MDYSIGSVADLISGSVTPNKQKVVKQQLKIGNVSPTFIRKQKGMSTFNQTNQKELKAKQLQSLGHSKSNISPGERKLTKQEALKRKRAPLPTVKKLKKNTGKEVTSSIKKQKIIKRGISILESDSDDNSLSNNDDCDSEEAANMENGPPLPTVKKLKKNTGKEVTSPIKKQKTIKRGISILESDSDNELSNNDDCDSEEAANMENEIDSNEENGNESGSNEEDNEADSDEDNNETYSDSKTDDLQSKKVSNKKDEDDSSSDVSESEEKSREEDENESDSDSQSDDLQSEKATNTQDQNKTKNPDYVTVFVGNLPIATTTKKLKKLFSKFGEVQNTRIRSIPVADPKIPKKVAAIKKQFHPNRTSVNGYVKFTNRESAEKALAFNGKEYKDHHIRVNISDETRELDKDKAIFLGNVSFEAEEEDLWKLFQSCGEIENVRLVRDRRTDVVKGFGFVNFKSADSVELALQMGEVKLRNRVLRISLYNSKAPKKPKPESQGKRANRKRYFAEKLKSKTAKTAPVNEQFQGKVATQKKKTFKKGNQQQKNLAKKIAPKST